MIYWDYSVKPYERHFWGEYVVNYKLNRISYFKLRLILKNWFLCLLGATETLGQSYLFEDLSYHD